jgi:transposase
MPRKQYSSDQKLKIVLEALKEERLMSDIASEYGVHPNVIHRWKKELLEGADKIFNTSKDSRTAGKEKKQQEETIENLYTQVGRLTTQLDWLKKKSGDFLSNK